MTWPFTLVTELLLLLGLFCIDLVETKSAALHTLLKWRIKIRILSRALDTFLIVTFFTVILASIATYVTFRAFELFGVSIGSIADSALLKTCRFPLNIVLVIRLQFLKVLKGMLRPARSTEVPLNDCASFLHAVLAGIVTF